MNDRATRAALERHWSDINDQDDDLEDTFVKTPSGSDMVFATVVTEP